MTHHCGDEGYAELAAGRVDARARQDDGSYEPEWIDSEAVLRVFRVLKDADALDRVRLGDLDPSYLRFEVSRESVERAWELLREIP